MAEPGLQLEQSDLGVTSAVECRKGTIKKQGPSVQNSERNLFQTDMKTFSGLWENLLLFPSSDRCWSVSITNRSHNCNGLSHLTAPTEKYSAVKGPQRTNEKGIIG